MSFSALALLTSVLAQSPAQDAADLEYFERNIRPVLATRCYKCHSVASSPLRSELRLDSRAGMLRGGKRGPAVVPGAPEESLLLGAIRQSKRAIRQSKRAIRQNKRAIRQSKLGDSKGDADGTPTDDELAMPPGDQLDESDIRHFAHWIELGAPWPAESEVTSGEEEQRWDWDALRQEHWAFQPVARGSPPPIEDVGWPTSAIDLFVLAKLEGEGLTPAPRANRRTLIRRVSLDLVGLPPTLEDIEAFEKDTRPGAFERVVDRLLASPHYGERWARHWLDVARYSDGMGAFQDGSSSPFAYFYRDWVVEAMNRDLPFDEFARRQIAGDLIDDGKDRVALGFFALGPTYVSDGGTPTSIALARADTLEDRVDTLCRGFLGITAACARCHDHKFDPVPTLDYYSLAGIFNNTQVSRFPRAAPDVVKRYEDAQKAIQEADRRRVKFIKLAQLGVQTQLVRNISDYLLATREYRAATLGSEPIEPEEYAKSRGLLPKVFSSCLKFTSRPKNRTSFPILTPWFDLEPAATPDVDPEREAAVKIAKEFEAYCCWLVPAYEAEFRAFQEAEARQRKDPSVVLPPRNRKWRDLVDRLSVFTGVESSWKDHAPEAEVIEATRLEAALETARAAVPPKYPEIHVLEDVGSDDMPVALRGDLLKPGRLAPRRFLGIVAGDTREHFVEGSGRLQLADAIASRKNPLTARVFVNRVWLRFFGAGLVRTPSNFGKLGEPPTHPRLLDWLARQFMASGWSVKALHRAVLLSSTYQMSSQVDAKAYARDGGNRLLWRMSPRRLDVETWRDALLAVSGGLDPTLGGPSTQELLESPRRTLYAAISRNGDRLESDAFLALFDFPSPRLTSAQRNTSTVPQQFLFMLNSPFMQERARNFSRNLATQHGDDGARIDLAYQALYLRSPTNDERQAGLDFLAAEPSSNELKRLTPWEQYAQVLLSAGEFLYVR